MRTRKQSLDRPRPRTVNNSESIAPRQCSFRRPGWPDVSRDRANCGRGPASEILAGSGPTQLRVGRRLGVGAARNPSARLRHLKQCRWHDLPSKAKPCEAGTGSTSFGRPPPTSDFGPTLSDPLLGPLARPPQLPTTLHEEQAALSNRSAQRRGVRVHCAAQDSSNIIQIRPHPRPVGPNATPNFAKPNLVSTGSARESSENNSKLFETSPTLDGRSPSLAEPKHNSGRAKPQVWPKLFWLGRSQGKCGRAPFQSC